MKNLSLILALLLCILIAASVLNLGYFRPQVADGYKPAENQERAEHFDVSPVDSAQGSFESASSLVDESSNSISPSDKEVLRASNGGSLGLQLERLPRGVAAIDLSQRSVVPPNYSGHYQRVRIEADGEADIELQWDDIGERPIIVHAIHGGTING